MRSPTTYLRTASSKVSSSWLDAYPDYLNMLCFVHTAFIWVHGTSRRGVCTYNMGQSFYGPYELFHGLTESMALW